MTQPSASAGKRIVQASRASAILFGLLAVREDRRPWLLPANICTVVPLTFLKARVPFELVDITPGTLNMDLQHVLRRLERSPCGGILFAHPYGQEYTPEDFFGEVKSRHPDMTLIDDRCLCVPGLVPRASFADVTLYSTGYSKMVDLGTGGYAFIADTLPYRPPKLPFAPRDYEAIMQAIKDSVQRNTRFVYRECDWLDTRHEPPPWSDYSARIGDALEDSLKHRAAINAIYAAALPAEIQLPSSFQHWRFNIRVDDKQRILDAIFAAGLFASSHYASLAGIVTEGRAPHAETLHGEVINLFNDHRFDPRSAERACRLITEQRP